MQDLLDRIVAAAPDPLRLTDDEFAKLSAYLRTHRRTVSLAAMQRAQRGDLAERARLEQDKMRWQALQCTLEYNRELRTAAATAPAQDLAATDAGKVKGGRPKVTAAEANTPADAGQGEDDEDLSPSRVKAKAVYEWALASIDGADRMTRTELYNAIAARLEAEAAKAKGLQAELLADLRDSLPPNAEAFGKYLRDAGVKVYDGKGDRRPGRSIRRVDQV